MALFAPKLLNELYKQSAVNTHYSMANNCDFALSTLLYKRDNELYNRICGKEWIPTCVKSGTQKLPFIKLVDIPNLTWACLIHYLIRHSMFIYQITF